MAGYAPCTSTNCCSYCRLKLQEIDNFDKSTWVRMTWEDHLSIAMQWRDAPSEAARCALYDKHGIRWSELLRLPYWDPTKFTLLDTMHTLLLVLIQKHCCEVWGMDDQFDDGPGATYDKLIMNQPPSYEQIQNGIRILRTGTVNDLHKLSESVLRFMCQELQIRFGGKKGKLIKHLTNLVRSICTLTVHTLLLNFVFAEKRDGLGQ